MNTVFQQRKANRKWTWESPDGRTKNMIDFIMVNKRWKSSITNCRTYAGPDIASDHRLVMAGVRIKLRRTHRVTMNRRFDMEALGEGATRDQFRSHLENRWSQIKEQDTGTVEDLWREIRTAYTDAAQQVLGHEKRRKKKPWITREILELSDKRREMRGTRTQNEANMGRYRAITKEIKKKSKQCKEEWIEERCKEVESTTGMVNTGKLFQTAREICGTGIVRLATVKNKEGKLLDNKEEIKQRWKQHYRGAI